LLPWVLRNRWSNCLSLGLNLQWSHIYRERKTLVRKNHFPWAMVRRIWGSGASCLLRSEMFF
jgi:hypothetical protein